MANFRFLANFRFFTLHKPVVLTLYELCTACITSSVCTDFVQIFYSLFTGSVLALFCVSLRFKDVIECERIVVKSFQSPHEVSSFRASKLPDDFYQAKAGLDKRRTTMYSKVWPATGCVKTLCNYCTH